MAEHIWSVVCYKGCVDRFSNQVSLLDVVERLTISTAEEIPEEGAGVPVHLNVVTLWNRTDPTVPETGRAGLDLRLPNGRVIESEDVIAVDLATSDRARTIFKLSALPYVGDGQYRFVVRIAPGDEGGDWQECAAVPLVMRLDVEEQPAPATPPPSKKKKKK